MSAVRALAVVTALLRRPPAGRSNAWAPGAGGVAAMPRRGKRAVLECEVAVDPERRHIMMRRRGGMSVLNRENTLLLTPCRLFFLVLLFFWFLVL